MNLLLVDATQWILPAILLVMVIGLFIMNYVKNKKYQETTKNMVSALKKGDRVKTYSGFYGKILEIKETAEGKIVTLETGSAKNKGYLAIDINAIYGIVDEKPAVAETAPVVEVENKTEAVDKTDSPAPKEEIKEVKAENVEVAKKEKPAKAAKVKSDKKA